MSIMTKDAYLMKQAEEIVDIQQKIDQEIEEIKALEKLWGQKYMGTWESEYTGTWVQEKEAEAKNSYLTASQMQQVVYSTFALPKTLVPSASTTWTESSYYEAPHPTCHLLSLSLSLSYELREVSMRTMEYTFCEDDLAAYLDGFEDDQTIGLAFSPINCMVARALSLKYPGVSYIYVNEAGGTIGGYRFYFSTRVRDAITLFDAVGGDTYRTKEEPYPAISKGAFTQALRKRGMAPFTHKVVAATTTRTPWGI